MQLFHPETSLDALLCGKVKLEQPLRGHRAGTDAVLLAACAQGTGTLADIGAGTGAAGLMAARLSGWNRLVLAEIDPWLCELARSNMALNDMKGDVIEVDILARTPQRHQAGLASCNVDFVLTNPPFWEQGRPSPEAMRARAHHMREGGLKDWIRTCCDLLKAKGRIVLIHRTEALPSCLEALGGGFGDIRLLPVHTKEGLAASRILIGAVKGSRAPLTLLPGLTLHEANGDFTPHAAAIHRGERAIAIFGE